MLRYSAWIWTLAAIALVGSACNPKVRGVTSCETDADCDRLARCLAQICVDIECQHSGDCPSGQYCVDNFCIDNVTCQSDADCFDPTPVCDTASGRCVDCVADCVGKCCGPDGCGGVCQDTCSATGQQCDQSSCLCQGECQANCANRECGSDGCGDTCGACATGEICDQGQCRPAGCQSDADCQAPRPICQTGSGLCVECADDADCEGGLICSGGVCAGSPGCTNDNQCEMGQICFDGECLAGCASNRDCPDGQTCLPDLGAHGRCVECQGQGDCDPGTLCQDYVCVEHCTSDNHCTPLHCDQATNTCVACTEDAHCPDEGEICLGFQCVPGCRLDDDCPSGHCNVDEHRCVQCVDPDDCPLGSLCIGEQCLQGCQTNRDCPADLFCDTDLGEHGSCVECLLNSDCPPTYACVQGLCEFQCDNDGDCQAPRPACDTASGVCVECTSSDHCLAGTICISQACVPGCLADRDCPPAMVCDATLGQHGACVACLVDGDCYSGQLCENGQCVIEGSEMIRLPGGSFIRGSDAGEGEDDERPEATVTVPTYYLDRTEVSNDQYRACVQAGACTEPSDLAAYNDPNRSSHPVVFVNWDQAYDFCYWMSKGLPTEARWERAARGLAPSERTYPWGDGAADCARANYSGCVGDTLPVGAHAAGNSPEGVMDLAGNVYEWAYDLYSATYYGDSTSFDDPYGPLDGEYRAVRGGSYDSVTSHIRAANRAGRDPAIGHPDVGFRCGLRGSPSADFSVAPPNGPYASTNFAVDASLSTDPNHLTDALEVHWDWEDDGVWDTLWTAAKTASHRYAFHGIFRIRLQVRDPDGNLSEATDEVVAEGQGGWDGDTCASDQDCAHGFICVMTLSTFGVYYCREECLWLIDDQCHLPDRTCNWTLDPISNACLPAQ